MEDISAPSDDELDDLLLAQANANWQKVAMIIAQAIIADKNEKWDENRMGGRIVALVEAGKLESAGNVRKWRFSEVRLPSET